MMNGRRIWAMAVAMAVAGTAMGDVLARWNTSVGGNQSAGSYEATATADGVTASALHTGGGLTKGGSTANNIFAAYGYEKTSAVQAMTAGDYWETSLAVGSGTEMQLSKITTGFGGPKSGPQFCQLAWSTDQKSWTYMPEINLGRTSTKYFTNSITGDDLGDLGYGVTGTVWFRLVAWGGQTTATACGSFGQNGDDFVFEGTLASSAGEPTLAFRPASPWTYVGVPLTVTVKARPAGADIKSITVDRATKGTWTTTNLSAGTWAWTFTPKKGDANQTYRLTAVATNAYKGYSATTNSVDVRVKGEVTPGTLTIDFEGVTGESTSWSGTTLALPAGSGTNWVLEGAIVRNGDTTDRKHEKAALVFTKDGVGTMTSQGKVLPGGIGKISYCYGVNSGYLEAGQPLLTTLVSEDGESWVEADQAETSALGAQGALTEHSFEVGVGVPVYLRFRCDGFSGSAQVNLDDVVIQPRGTPTTYDAWLQKYNVTPGDPGTASGEDLDGDGFKNGGPGSTEQAHKTNPYDPDEHP